MRMRRMMVAPERFGSDTLQGWQTDASPTALEHHDYTTITNEWSIRVWEPGRESLSMPGSVDYGDPTDQRGPNLPATTTIHGIKGEVLICPTIDSTEIGVWLDPATGELLDPQPSVSDTLIALGVRPAPVNTLEGNSNLHDMMRNGRIVRIPLFIALYRGTYKQIDQEGGWEIDSGPGSDPDTLLNLDISNPSVLEDSRIDWWDMEWLTLPRAHQTRRGSDTSSDFELRLADVGVDGHGGPLRYKINLDANKTLAPGQVLWLHFRVGSVKLFVYSLDDLGNFVYRAAIYTGHPCSWSCHASMMVSRKIQV